MALEKYLALAGLALSVFFVAEIITIFNFMSNPLTDETFLFEAKPKIFQFISMSVAPAMIVFGVSFVLSKRYGSKLNGSLIVAGGAIILIGMIYAYTMIENIEEKLIDDPDIYAEMVTKSGQPLSPCVEIDGEMLADVG